MKNTILIDLGQGERGAQRLAALNEMASEYGFEWGGNPSIGRLIVALADQYKESKMSDKTNIRYGFHGADLFVGWDDDEKYNIPASAAKYAELVEAELKKQYPGAEIETPYDLDAGGVLPAPLQAAVNDDPNHQDVPILDHIAAQVYESYDWAIES